ncbi:Uncharacterised protein [Mycobacteroides abscessus subsp. abscessus]|nr:Uncharacterised protein [Mycobacteroides abscessus subsp. abscessus]
MLISGIWLGRLSSAALSASFCAELTWAPFARSCSEVRTRLETWPPLVPVEYSCAMSSRTSARAVPAPGPSTRAADRPAVASAVPARARRRVGMTSSFRFRRRQPNNPPSHQQRKPTPAAR